MFGQPAQHLDLFYFWTQLQPIFGAIAIFLIGYFLALIISGSVKILLYRINLNQKINATMQKEINLEQILARIIFCFIFIIAFIAGLNVLNLTHVSTPFANMINSVLAFIPNLLAAAIVGFIGWLIATIIRNMITRGLAKTDLDEKLSRDVGITTISQNIADISYWLILLLFLSLILSILGLSGLLAPLQSMLTEAIGFIPHLFIAGIIVFVGYILAKIVRSIVEGLSQSIGLQAQAQKIKLFQSSNLPKILGSFSFTIIIITSLIIAFDALGVQSISQPATAMLQQIMTAIPNILAAGMILLIAYIISKFVSQLIQELLASTGIDQLPQKLEIQQFLGTQTISNLISKAIVFFTMLFAIAEAGNRLQFANLTDLINTFIRFGADIVLGAVILIIGFWLANIVAKIVHRSQNHQSKFLSNLVRVLIMGLVLAMGLKAMGIADSIVNLAFGLTLGGVTVAFALAFGLGGRIPAERLLTKLLDQVDQKDKNQQD